MKAKGLIPVSGYARRLGPGGGGGLGRGGDGVGLVGVWGGSEAEELVTCPPLTSNDHSCYSGIWVEDMDDAVVPPPPSSRLFLVAGSTGWD